MRLLKNLIINFEYTEALIGGSAIDKFNNPLPNETLEMAKKSDAVLLGAVGDWKYDKLPPESDRRRVY